ncbi:DDE superfamily endonuclease [Popillia japonica]|uniref:DDE superfamily endonuclease n=1 Tax=Popillia japonica TaxID=7064 RepID=A0AAW1IZY0_POPJA
MALKSFDDLSSSSSSSDTDTSMSDVDTPKKKNNIQNYIEGTVYKYSDEEFRSHFRLNRQCVEDLIEYYCNSKPKKYRGGWPEIKSEKVVLMSLWYLANTESFRQIADRIIANTSKNWIKLPKKQEAISRIIANTSKNWIKLPKKQEAISISSEFEKKQGIPNVLGCIDGCHIRTKKPKINGDDFINRKGYPSILLQGVVDHRKMFLDISVGAPGSIHDARLLRQYKLFEEIETGRQLLYNKYHLLGGSAYPVLNWLIPPYKDNGLLTEQQRLFNFKHSATRIVVEHGFGVLNGRFRRLREFQNDSLSFIVHSVVAAWVLHNICISRNIEDNNVIEYMEDLDNNVESEETVEGFDKREEICNLFTNN